MIGDKEIPPALLLGDDPVNTLGVARNLGRLGIPLFRLGADPSKILDSRYIESRWVSKGLDDFTDEDYLDLLNTTADKIGRRAVLFPLSDIHVLRVSSNKPGLSERYDPVAADAAIAETLVNKRRFYTSLEERGVPHPKARFPKLKNEFVAAADEIGYPVFLKPEISPLFARKFRTKGLVAENRDELLRHLDTVEGSGIDVMVQEIIPGDAACMHGCAGVRASSDVGTFCYRRVREYPPNFGCGSLLTSVDNFVDQTPLLKYLEDIDYQGIFDAEYKLDPRDGVFKNIEINARSWWQNLHPSASGINLVKAAYDFAAGHTPELPQSYNAGITWMHLYNDYFARKDSGIGLLSWLRSLGSVGEFDIWDADDKGPMMAYLGEIAGRKVSRVFGGSRTH